MALDPSVSGIELLQGSAQNVLTETRGDQTAVAEAQAIIDALRNAATTLANNINIVERRHALLSQLEAALENGVNPESISVPARPDFSRTMLVRVLNQDGAIDGGDFDFAQALIVSGTDSAFNDTFGSFAAV